MTFPLIKSRTFHFYEALYGMLELPDSLYKCFGDIID